MFAYVPTVPGPVVSVVESMPSPLPEGKSASQYESCGSMVIAGWNFDGNSFTPPLPHPPVIPTPPPLTPAQIAQNAGMAALAAGIDITSTSAPEINGTYSLTSNTLLMVTGAISYCLLKNQFPGGASTLTFFDAAGTPHVFSSIAEFEAFAEAIASYVNQIQDYINSGGTSGALPTSNAVTIA